MYSCKFFLNEIVIRLLQVFFLRISSRPNFRFIFQLKHAIGFHSQFSFTFGHTVLFHLSYWELMKNFDVLMLVVAFYSFYWLPEQTIFSGFALRCHSVHDASILKWYKWTKFYLGKDFCRRGRSIIHYKLGATEGKKKT